MVVIERENKGRSCSSYGCKYAEGELGEDRSFYFRGPDNVLNLRAKNLTLFLQTAQGVDDRTWEHHLRNGDYSAWFRHVIKDDALAREAAEIDLRTTPPIHKMSTESGGGP